MAWSREQNPTGVSNPAIRAIQPAVVSPTESANARVLASVSRAFIRDNSGLPPISASARKADGFAPR